MISVLRSNASNGAAIANVDDGIFTFEGKLEVAYEGKGIGFLNSAKASGYVMTMSGSSISVANTGGIGIVNNGNFILNGKLTINNPSENVGAGFQNTNNFSLGGNLEIQNPSGKNGFLNLGSFVIQSGGTFSGTILGTQP